MTIEERAILSNPYEKEHYDSPYEINIADKYAEGYIDGSTDQDPISRADQKKRDIDKIKNILYDNLYLGDSCTGGWLPITFIDKVCKAMEE